MTTRIVGVLEFDRPPLDNIMGTKMEYTRESIIITEIIIVVVLQHLGRRFDVSWIKVSFYLEWIVWGLRSLSRGLGIAYGYIATFPSLVQFWEIYNTFREIIQPIWDMVNIPFDYRDAVIATASKVATVEHMRVGTIIMAWLGFMWWRGYMEELYFGVVGVVVGIMIITHLVVEAILPHKEQTNDMFADEPVQNPVDHPSVEPSMRSPPVRRRGRRSQAIVVASTAIQHM